MAYMLQSNDDDEQERQPSQSGVGPSPMTQGGAQRAPTAAPSSPMTARPRSDMQGRGSGMVNLESFLTGNVAQQNQQKIVNTGGQLQQQERDTFNKAADPLRQASFSAVQGNARELVDKIVPQAPAQPANAAAHIAGSKVEGGRVWVPMPGFPGQFREYDPKRDGVSQAQTAASQQQQSVAKNSLSQLQSMLSQDYTGPMSVNYDANNANAQRLGQLGNVDTTLNALSPGSFTENLPNQQGNNWLDRALLQSDAGTMAEIGRVKSGAEAFRKNAAAETEALANKAHGLKNEAKAARDKARGELETYGKEILGGIDARAKAANDQESADYKNNVLRDPTTGKVIRTSELRPGQKQTNNWEAGSGAVGQGANRGNISNETERGRLGQIASLLGMDSYNVAPAGQYTSGRYTTEMDVPTLIAHAPGTPKYGDWVTPTKNNTPPATGAQIRAATKDLTPEQLKKYQEARQQGYTVENAAEIARGGTGGERPVGELPMRPVNW